MPEKIEIERHHLEALIDCAHIHGRDALFDFDSEVPSPTRYAYALVAAESALGGDTERWKLTPEEMAELNETNEKPAAA